MINADFAVTEFSNFDSHNSDFCDINRVKVMFNNGFGASIITGQGSYSSEGHPYELAVIDKGGIRYDTPISDDVLGHLNADEVKKILFEISGLIPDSMKLENV